MLTLVTGTTKQNAINQQYQSLVRLTSDFDLFEEVTVSLPRIGSDLSTVTNKRKTVFEGLKSTINIDHDVWCFISHYLNIQTSFYNARCSGVVVVVVRLVVVVLVV
jgi:hypothetical protein